MAVTARIAGVTQQTAENGQSATSHILPNKQFLKIHRVSR